MMRLRNNPMTEKLATSVFIIAALLAGVSLPRQAHAQATGAACAVGAYLSSQIAGSIGGLVGSALNVPVADTQTHTKEFTLDRLASCAAKELLHQMTVSTVRWINSGFNGSPAFITNPGRFFVDAADQVTGAFLADSGPLRNLCSPWSIDLRLSLALGQAYNGGNREGRYYCTLGQIIDNAKNANVSINGFVNGDFSQGGWRGFIALTTDPQNNPYGAYLQAHSDLLTAIGLKQSSISQDLLEGQGFMSWQSCEDIPEDEVDQEALGRSYGDQYTAGGTTIRKKSDGSGYEQCTRQTPGSVIAHTLNVHSDAGIVETELANDINSVVNTLVTQLASQMLSKGLYALTGRGSGVSSGGYSNLDSYISQLQNDSLAGQAATSYAQAVNLITASRANYAAAKACYADKQSSALAEQGTIASSGGDPAVLQARLAAIQAQITAIDATLALRVDPLLNSLTSRQTLLQTSGAANAATVSADLANAQTQAQTFNTEATAFLNACTALP